MIERRLDRTPATTGPARPVSAFAIRPCNSALRAARFLRSVSSCLQS